MNALIQKSTWLLFPLAGVLQTFTLAPYNYWILGPLSIALLLFPLFSVEKDDLFSVNKGFLKGWLFGVGLFGSGTSWVYISIHVYGYAPPVLAGTLTGLFVMGLGLFHGLFFWLLQKMGPMKKTAMLLSFICIWVLGDWFRTWFLTGFPWMFLGYGHVSSPLSGWAPVVGVYGLNTFVVITGAALWLFVDWFRNKQNDRKPLIAFASITVLIWLSGHPLKSVNWTEVIPNSERQVAIAQINIPQEIKWHPKQRRKTLRLLEDISREYNETDIMVWPETAVPILHDKAIPYLSRNDAFGKNTNTNIITGIPFRGPRPDGEGQVLHNSILSLGVGEGIYHKQKLVPFGEYVPLQELLRGLIQFFDLPMSDFRTGPSNQALLNSHGDLAAPYICYEVVYPDFAADLARGSNFLITISNDSWFGASIGPLQHLEMAQMRALETGRYMIRGTNNGVSAIIDPKGEILTRSPQFVQVVLTGSLHMVTGETPYMKTLSYPLLAILAAVLIAMFILNKKHGEIMPKS